MREPRQPGDAIDERRRRGWINRFGSYRAGIDNVAITSWLEQFDETDRDVAARILDVVEYYGQSQIFQAYKQALTSLQGWDPAASKRQGKWAFCAMSRSAGESGDAMLHNFRLANKLDKAKYNKLFLSRSDLFRLPNRPESDPDRFGANDVVVLLDDFSGTGRQVCDAWNDPVTSYGALLAGVGTVYLIVVAASQRARKQISEQTEIKLVPAYWLEESDNVFSAACRHFSNSDRVQLLRYCQRADRSYPKGSGESGLVVVFQHRAPNNSIPILHANNRKWTGLFPRH